MNISKVAFLAALILASSQAYAQSTVQENTDTTKLVAETPEHDAMITDAVKKLLKDSPSVSTLDIDVSTNKGVVMLSGNVNSNTQASEVITLAESVIGVADVNASQLTVNRSERPLADTITTAKIKGLLIREDLFGEKDVASFNTNVETKNGVVYLSGVVDNKAQIDNAIAIIKKSVPEVKEVVYSMKKFVNE